MTLFPRRLGLALAATSLLAACDSGSTDTLVARAHDFEFTVDDAVRLIGPQDELPNDPAVVRAVADLWIDFTLLAWAGAQDSTWASLDLQPLVEQLAEGRMVSELRDSVIAPDTTVTEEELRGLFAEQAPGTEARARHILLGLPPQATPAQRDSVRRALEEIRGRIVAGESFEALAREYSQDPGSARNGGDLGYFARGDMVQPLDERVFSMEVGAVSEVFETPFGYHVVRLEDLVTPSFDESRVEYRQRLIEQRIADAEVAYVEGVLEAASPEYAAGAAEIVREIARDPRARLSRRAAGRTLVAFEGGEVTVDDLREYLQGQGGALRAQIVEATDEQIEGGVLEAIMQRELLVERAREQGLEPSAERLDSIRGEVRAGFARAAQSLGLADIVPLEGETMADAVERLVGNLMTEVVAGRTNVYPLGPISVTLRRDYRNEVFQAGLLEASRRLEEIRGPTQQGSPATTPAGPEPNPITPPAADFDSVGG